MPAKARARSVSPTFMAKNTRARKEDNAEDDVAADDDAILGKYMAIAASGHANHPETTEAETAPKKEHNAPVSYNASLSSRLSVVADPNSTVYKQLTTEEVDTLLSRPRWREFAFNLLARGLVVYKKQTKMVYVFDHEAGCQRVPKQRQAKQPTQSDGMPPALVCMYGPECTTKHGVTLLDPQHIVVAGCGFGADLGLLVARP